TVSGAAPVRSIRITVRGSTEEWSVMQPAASAAKIAIGSKIFISCLVSIAWNKPRELGAGRNGVMTGQGRKRRAERGERREEIVGALGYAVSLRGQNNYRGGCDERLLSCRGQS